jgi:hypothetical protein
MRITSFAKDTVPSEREIRCNDMWRGDSGDVDWDLDSIAYLRGAAQMLCVAGVVYIAIRHIGTVDIVDSCWFDGRERSHDFHSTIVGNHDRSASANCRVEDGILPGAGNRFFGKPNPLRLSPTTNILGVCHSLLCISNGRKTRRSQSGNDGNGSPEPIRFNEWLTSTILALQYSDNIIRT